MSVESAENVLTAGYRAEVEHRGGKVEMDEETKLHIRNLAEALTAERPRIGFALCGPCGNGKTTLLYALNSAIELMKRSNLTRLISTTDNLWVVDALQLATTARTNDTMFYEMCNAKMLAIEDMGKEAAEVVSYGNTLNPIAEVIERRYDKQLFTAITTNLTPKMLSEKYGSRVADRFREMLTVITFKNESYRK